MENMSRDFTRPRSNSSVDRNVQKVLNLDSSPGSSRKIGDDGESEKVNIPNFSEEVLSDFEDDSIKPAVESTAKNPESQSSSLLTKPVVLKGILKRRISNQQRNVTEVQRNTKCCHPLVNKIRHIADKTLQKLERNETEKMASPNEQKIDNFQEIKQLKCSPGASRRQKFGTIKLGDSDEMSKMPSLDITINPIKNKNHIYEDIEEKTLNLEGFQDDIFTIQKSRASQDPSLVSDIFQPEDFTIGKLHSENIDNMGEHEEHFDDTLRNRTDVNITTERVHSDSEPNNDECNDHIEMSLCLNPQETDTNLNEVEFKNSQWSKSSSDHEYEIVEKPSPSIVYNHTSANQISTDDELFFSNSLNQDYVSQASNGAKSIDNETKLNSDINEGVLNIESVQENTEDRYLTPTVVTETKYESSTDQVETTPLKNEVLKCDSKVQDRFKEGTRKLKTQANKLKTKLHTLKSKQFNMPEKAKIKFPERPIFSFPQRPKLSMPYRSKKDIKPESVNIGHKYNVKKKSTYSIPNFPKFVVPGLPKDYFSKIYKKKDSTAETNTCELSSNENIDDGDFERKFEHSFAPISNRDNVSSREFSFTRPKRPKKKPTITASSPKQTQDYSYDKSDDKMEEDIQINTIYGFEKSNPEYINESETLNFNKNQNETSIPFIEREVTHMEDINSDDYLVQSRGSSHENIGDREYLNNEILQAFKIPRNILLSMRTNADSDEEIEASENDPYQYSNDQDDVKHSRFYTFPPVRPSRVKNKTEGQQSIKYIDESANTSKQVSEDNIEFTEYQDINEESIQYIDERLNTCKQFNDAKLDLTEDQDMNNVEIIQYVDENINPNKQFSSEANSDFTGDQDTKGVISTINQFSPSTDIHCVHEYANDIIAHQDNFTTQHETQPIPPKRIKKYNTKVSSHSPNTDSNNLLSSDLWEPQEQIKDIIVYQTQYEYINPQAENVTEQCIVPPRRNRSRNMSLCGEDHTSRDTKPLVFGTHSLETGIFDIEREIRCDDSEYATVNKRPYVPARSIRRSKSKTPSARRRKSNSSERKYYTVEVSKATAPSRPIRKKSSSSLNTFDYKKRSISTEFKLFGENNDAKFVDDQKGLNSCEIMSKMKDRPLPPPPRPPRGPKKLSKMKDIHNFDAEVKYDASTEFNGCDFYPQQQMKDESVVEVEVSTQTDQLPDNVNFELVMNKSKDVSILSKDNFKVADGSRSSCPTSEHSFDISDYFNTERTSPNVILIERNISGPTRINERDEILTEASLIVQHIDINETQTSNVLPFPTPDTTSSVLKNIVSSNEEPTLEIMTDASKEIKIDNLVTQRLRVKELDVSHLNVSELQAGRLQVSQTNEVDYSSARISESAIEISQSIIDEVVRKFSEITSTKKTTSQIHPIPDTEGIQNKEEQTQTDWSLLETNMREILLKMNENDPSSSSLLPFGQNETQCSVQPSRTTNADNSTPYIPIQPTLTPLLYSYFQDTSLPPASFYATRSLRETPLPDINDPHQSPSTTTRRTRRPSASPPSESSSSDEGRPHHSPKTSTLRAHDLTITEAGAQFMSVCQKSISRVFKSIFKYCISYINATDDKKDMQMAFVIFLVLIAGLVMFGLSDLRTIHHHHWEFFNPPDGTQRPL